MTFFNYHKPDWLIEDINEKLERGDSLGAKEYVRDVYLSAVQHGYPDYMATAADLIVRGQTPTKDSFDRANLKNGEGIDREAAISLGEVILEHRKYDLYEEALPHPLYTPKPELESLLSKIDGSQPLLGAANREPLSRLFNRVVEDVEELRVQYVIADRAGKAKTQISVYNDPLLNSTYDVFDEEDKWESEGGSHLPDFNDSPVKDPKPKTPAPPNPEFNAGREVSGSLPPGVSLQQSGYKKHYRG